jgi:hypothetical protein
VNPHPGYYTLVETYENGTKNVVFKTKYKWLAMLYFKVYMLILKREYPNARLREP